MTEREKALREALEIVEEAQFNALQHGQGSPWIGTIREGLTTLLYPTDGWIPWHGGECPVDPETRVWVRFARGAVTDDAANFFGWGHNGTSGDIIAYRVISEPEKDGVMSRSSDPLDRPVAVREMVALLDAEKARHERRLATISADYLERKARGES